MKRRHLINEVGFLVLIFSASVSMFYFFDSKKGYYLALVKSLRDYSINQTMKNTDPHADILEALGDFDPEVNKVIFATSERESSEFEWLFFQIDYYFYPTIPEILDYPAGDDLNAHLAKNTTSGDIIIAIDDLQLNNDNFSLQEKHGTITDSNHFFYVRK